jgi:hypothetical protein
MFTFKSLGLNVLLFPEVVQFLSYEIEFLLKYNIIWFQFTKFAGIVHSSSHVTSLK